MTWRKLEKETNERVENKKDRAELTSGQLLAARITDALINYRCDDGCDAVRKAQHPKNQQQQQQQVWTAARASRCFLLCQHSLLCLLKHMEIDDDARPAFKKRSIYGGHNVGLVWMEDQNKPERT